MLLGFVYARTLPAPQGAGSSECVVPTNGHAVKASRLIDGARPALRADDNAAKAPEGDPPGARDWVGADAAEGRPPDTERASIFVASERGARGAVDRPPSAFGTATAPQPRPIVNDARCVEPRRLAIALRSCRSAALSFVVETGGSEFLRQRSPPGPPTNELWGLGATTAGVPGPRA